MTDPAPDVVELTIPASSAWIALVRTAATATAARLDYSVERIDDLSLAVDEACSLLVATARPGTQVTCRFTVAADRSLDVFLATPTDAPVPDSTSFAWIVLTALVDDVDARTDGQSLSLHLRLTAAVQA